MIRVLGKGITAKAIEEAFDEVKLYDDSDFETYDKSSNEITVVSPGIMPANEMVKNSNNVISEYDLFADIMPFSIWISGTNGKTTTTQMCQQLLEKRGSVCGGNIGTPLANLDKDANLWILETSSFTNHYTNKAKPNLYILLPISEDHISWHGSFEEYKKAKLKPLDFMGEGEIAIIPQEYKDYKTDALVITYKNSYCLCKEFGIEKKKIKFKEPFLLDSIMALASSKILFDEIDYELINSFVIDQHKVEEFYDKKNRLWIDDSKATNVDATINALKPYSNKKINLILGGDDKGANLKPLFEELKNYDITIFAIGSNEEKIHHLSKEFGIEFYGLKILKNAVEKIDQIFTQNSVGMLSPAAASLDQFTSYKHRGEEFKNLVSSLSKN
ncbi:MAG: UDP-N-acetylmuramoyl-L-alanine--D-glutamate ligase [Arcobacter sp.]|nr:MAG: UDP-N-acetylmuramoyl-L-alanine--D-glutamate ligase [Arcobacter sp.]